MNSIAPSQQRYGWKPERWPNATRLGRQTVSLPLSPKLGDADVARVIDAVRTIVA
jgi:dTDP-4-amino-4,6-dideoxygalactose transaminase